MNSVFSISFEFSRRTSFCFALLENVLQRIYESIWFVDASGSLSCSASNSGCFDRSPQRA
jgi:hypothetical protein